MSKPSFPHDTQPLDKFLNRLGIKSGRETLRLQVQTLIHAENLKYHKPLVDIISRLKPEKLEQFVQTWSNLDPGMRTQFVAFITEGDDSNPGFLAYLNQNQECQQAVDLAFAANMERLQEFGRALFRAEERLTGRAPTNPLGSLLCDASQVEKTLGGMEQTLEDLAREPKTSPLILPILGQVRSALAAVVGTKTGLAGIAGKQG